MKSCIALAIWVAAGMAGTVPYGILLADTGLSFPQAVIAATAYAMIVAGPLFWPLMRWR